jgi:predicted ribosome quality control (RQC) complex YloA/Tae2 family protein
MRYDALLTRHLAAELNERYAGSVVHGVELVPDRQHVLIDVGPDRLQWNLHPTSGYLGRTTAVLPLDKPIQLPRRARWKRAHAIFDERVLIVELTGQARPHATMQIIFELLTNQWNAITLDADGKVLRQLKPRTSAGRDIRRGQVYQPPHSAEARTTASQSEWVDIFQRLDPTERSQAFLRRFAYASPLNVAAVFAATSLESAFARYQELLRESLPHIVTIKDERQPYSHHLWSPDPQPQESLLAASESLGGFDISEDVATEIARRLFAAEKKLTRLREELQNADTRGAALRAQADLLMAYSSTITRGAKRVTLPDFEGRSTDIELDPALTPIENAQEFYHEARKQQRAAERLPGLVQQAEAARARLLEVHARAQEGSVTDADLRSLIRKPPQPKQRAGGNEKLPYRRYRTSGGLEVRVGRNSRANDEVTLHHTSPRDVWLHARHVGGAHVVLRWNEVEANPPMRDLMEAAMLAAFHSKARTSRTVPVDYTRRKYVTKRKKSPPGQVMIERAKTLFVEPSEQLEEQLRWPEED